MTDRQLRIAAATPPLWLREHQAAAERRVSRARLNYSRAQETGDLIEVTAARVALRDAFAVKGEWGAV